MSTHLADEDDRKRSPSDGRVRKRLDVPDPSARIVDVDEDLGDVPVVDITDDANAAWMRNDDQFVPPSSMDADEFHEFVSNL